MNRNSVRTTILVAGFVAAIAGAQALKVTKAASGAPRTTIPTFSTSDLSRTGIFYAGGKYVGEPGKETMGGDAYVEVWVPKQIRHPYPIVYIHGAGQTATDWLQTPDGRPGWAYYFAKQGYVQYMVDSPARGRSPYVPDHDGNLTIRTAPNLEAIFTASAKKGDFPRAHLQTQFPGTGLMGDPVFDEFARTQVQFLGGGGPMSQDELSRDAFVALLDMVKTPVIILSHSQGGTVGWLMADARPNQVKGIVTVEPAAPPIKNVDTAKIAYNTAGGGGLSWGVTASPIHYDPPIQNPAELQPVLEEKSDIPGDVVPCYLQKEPAHKLVNLEKIPVVYLSAEGGYHREFDHCLAKWLNQAGVKTQFVRMEDVGLRGNGHEMMLEKNSDEIAKYIAGWMDKNISQKDKPNTALPSSSAIPTFPTDNIARQGFFYAGGKYVGGAGKEIMGDAMYTEVWVPKQMRHPYPIVFFHGNGQSGAVWRQTPDNRPGWAYYLVDQGYTVYMVDYPARGRSPYVPGVDGKLGIRTALELEQIWTAPAASGGDFPRKNLYTQWPSDSPKKGMMGDPVFDNFIKGQMQFVNNQAELAIPAGIALLDRIGSPVILLTHSQGGGIGFNVADERPKLVAGMVAIEPGGPQIGTVDTAKVAYTRVNPNSWGLTPMPMKYDPPFNSPSDIKTHLVPSDRPDEVACYLQDEPVHKLAGYKGMPILSLSAEGTYHRVFDVCIPKWLNQAGAKDDFVRLEDVGIHGNMHEMFLDRNSQDVIKFIDGWIGKNVK
jgi:pimeloyl-ACP methyl ester carboxylesterase